jgi:pimeloyl-ACP methyl ester carboxylesterase
VQCASPVGLHRIAYTEWGDSANPQVLMCVHGLTRSGRDFDRVAAALADRYRVICPDVAGRGQSDWLANPALYVVPQYVSDMVTLIARLDVEQVDWFGTSMGGMIGMGLAGLPHTPIRKMILNDIGPHIEPDALTRIGEYVGQTPRFPSEQAGIDYLAELAQSFGPLSRDEWREINAPLLRADGDGWVVRYDPGISTPFRSASHEAIAAGEEALWRSIEAFAGPLLVVRGAESDLLSRETLSQMRARGRHVECVEIPGVGHAPAFVAEDQIALVRRFLLG